MSDIYKEFGVDSLRDSENAGPTAAEMKMAQEIERLRADRRERIATACLAGMLANSSYEGSNGTFNGCAYDAVMFADALIARLDKEAKP